MARSKDNRGFWEYSIFQKVVIENEEENIKMSLKPENSFNPKLINDYINPSISREEKLIENKSQAHVIVVGSHGAMWTSWPDISIERLSYNVSKETIQSFVTGLAHSGSSNLKLSVVNPTKFQSKLNGYQGYSIDIIVDGIIHVIQAPTPILIYEYNNYQDVNR